MTLPSVAHSSYFCRKALKEEKNPVNFLMSEDLKPDWMSACGEENGGRNRRMDDLNQQNVENFFVFHLLMFAVGSIIIIIID